MINGYWHSVSGEHQSQQHLVRVYYSNLTPNLIKPRKIVYKDKTIIYTNRSKITLTCKYAEKTPEGLWEAVYKVLLRAGVFDDLKGSL